jgi:hypothetical protein
MTAPAFAPRLDTVLVYEELSAVELKETETESERLLSHRKP